MVGAGASSNLLWKDPSVKGQKALTFWEFGFIKQKSDHYYSTYPRTVQPTFWNLLFWKETSYPPSKEYKIAFIRKIAGTSGFFPSSNGACLESKVFQRNFTQLIEA